MENEHLKFNSPIAFFMAVIEKMKTGYLVNEIKFGEYNLSYNFFPECETPRVVMSYYYAFVAKIQGEHFIIALGVPERSKSVVDDNFCAYPVNIIALPLDLKSNNKDITLAIKESIDHFHRQMLQMNFDPKPHVLKAESIFETFVEFINRLGNKIHISIKMDKDELVQKTVEYIINQIQSPKLS